MKEELLKKINNNNYKIINELIELITDENINNVSELKEYQNELFRTNGNLLSHKEEINYCVNNIKANGFVSEKTDFIDLQKIIKLKQNLDIQSEEEQNINIIILYSLLEKEMMLPYDAYIFIINDKI